MVASVDQHCVLTFGVAQLCPLVLSTPESLTLMWLHCALFAFRTFREISRNAKRSISGRSVPKIGLDFKVCKQLLVHNTY